MCISSMKKDMFWEFSRGASSSNDVCDASVQGQGEGGKGGEGCGRKQLTPKDYGL